MMWQRVWGFVSCLIAAGPVWGEDVRVAEGDAEVLPPQSRLVELWNEGEFTEGVAVASDGTVYFSDIAFAADGLGRVLKYDPTTGAVAVHCADSGKSNGLMFDRDGRLIACCGANKGRQAICEVTADGKIREIATSYRGKRFNSPNDLVVHPNGSVYFSDPRYVGKEPMLIEHQSVYRVDPDGTV
ncbi:MAG: SMP-30/gluconolactonase/LRE family protein, partial [Planctomycetaceae bacterium]